MDNKPLNRKFVNIDFKISAKGKLEKYALNFTDEKGKTVVVDPATCLGFKDNVVTLCRMGAYSYFMEGEPISFDVDYVTTNYISYKATFMNRNADLRPRQWISDDLGSPVIDEITYFKSHDRNLLKKFEDAYGHCQRSIRDKDVKVWAEKVDACYSEIPEFVAVYQKDGIYDLRNKPGRYVR